MLRALALVERRPSASAPALRGSPRLDVAVPVFAAGRALVDIEVLAIDDLGLRPLRHDEPMDLYETQPLLCLAASRGGVSCYA